VKFVLRQPQVGETEKQNQYSTCGCRKSDNMKKIKYKKETTTGKIPIRQINRPAAVADHNKKNL